MPFLKYAAFGNQYIATNMSLEERYIILIHLRCYNFVQGVWAVLSKSAIYETQVQSQLVTQSC